MARLACLLLTLLPLAVLAEEHLDGPPPTIAIIIDDMGHKADQGARLVRFEQPLTLAFLPYLPQTPRLAEAAHQHAKEIMLHAPMANTRNIGLGPGGLKADMDEQDIARTLRRALRAIPHVRGVNNHMGSQLTTMQDPMNWVMKELEKYPVYFVDSRTIATSVAGYTAATHRIPTVTRDVFLDHEQTTEYLEVQFEELIRTARENGTAIGIGHPHKVTVDFLEEKLPELDERGIAIATVSAVWAMRNGNRIMFADDDKLPIQTTVAEKP